MSLLDDEVSFTHLFPFTRLVLFKFDVTIYICYVFMFANNDLLCLHSKYVKHRIISRSSRQIPFGITHKILMRL